MEGAPKPSQDEIDSQYEQAPDWLKEHIPFQGLERATSASDSELLDTATSAEETQP